ncbi:MAG: aminotransferase class I/II-fold pyridoxal phosphate-dependent enzyme [Anaerolineae bacterium]|nr:aminotransferase class I/II-fold pyridoxal phosphate-dependent enzyme [Anaerolineae bacterium]
MSISHLARSIGESATLKLNEQAKLLADQGQPVIHLGGGEPKNKVPITAILSSAAKLNSGQVKYVPTDGTPSLKKAIIRYTEENYGWMVAPENVIVSSGAKQALYNVLVSIIDPQDEVIVLAPYWVSYPEMVKLVYGRPVIVKAEDGSFQPKIEEIERAISSNTKAIIVNSPNNPSGIVYPESFIAAVVELCESRGIYLIMDDIYQKLVFDGIRTASPYRFTQNNIETTHIIVVNGVSKLYGMTGFRIGWTVANRQLVRTMNTIQSQTTSCAAAVSMAAAEGALTGVQSTVENLRLLIQNNRDVAMTDFRTFPGVKIAKPCGTFYCLPDFSAYSKSSEELAALLLKKALVVTVPGKEFGAEGHLRLSYCGAAKEVSEGIKRIRWALDPEAPNEIYIGDRRVVRDWL